MPRNISSRKRGILMMQDRIKTSASKNSEKKASADFPKWLRIVATLLIVIGAISLSLGSIAYWVENSLVETERFVQLADDLIAQEEIREALAEGMVDAILEELPPRAKLARSVLISVTEAILEDERFQKLFSSAVENAHKGLLEKELPQFVFGIPDAMKSIKNGVGLFDPQLATELPDGSRLAETLEIGREVTGTIRWWAKTIRQLGPIFLILAFLGCVGGIALTERKWHGVFLLGWIMIVTISVMSVFIYILRVSITNIPDDPTMRAAVDAGWAVMARGIRINMLVLAFSGAFLALIGRWADGGGIEKLWSWIKEQWNAWKSGTRPGDKIWKYFPGISGKALAIILAIVGAVALIWPEPSTGFLALLIGFILLALAGLAFMSSGSLKKDESTEKAIPKGKKVPQVTGKTGEQPAYMDEIKSLAELHNDGIISKQEFDAKKKKLLGL